MVASVLDNLATLYQRQGKFDQAEPLFRRALRINETKLPAGHELRAQSLNNLTWLLFCAGGKDDEVEKLLDRALAEHDVSEGDEGNRQAVALVNVARLAAARGDWSGAVAATDRARRLVRRHAGRNLPAQSEIEQLMFLASDVAKSNEALSLGLTRATDPEACEKSAAWLINGKGIGLDALAEQSLLIRDADQVCAPRPRS